MGWDKFLCFVGRDRTVGLKAVGILSRWFRSYAESQHQEALLRASYNTIKPLRFEAIGTGAVYQLPPTR
jgi:hypothetical protein